MSVFDEIKTGLEQAIEYEQGTLKTRTQTLRIVTLSTFEPGEIKEIRAMTGLTQVAFAECMGVSVKTVEAWEAGRNHPDGAACRLLMLTKSDPQFLQKTGILTIQNR